MSKGIFSGQARDAEQDDQLTLQERQIGALLEGQHQLAKQMAEIVIAHQEIKAHHVTDLERVIRIERTIGETAVTLAKVEKIVDTVAALEGGLRVLGWLGTFVKWVASIAAACALLWGLFVYAINQGKLPPPHP